MWSELHTRQRTKSSRESPSVFPEDWEKGNLRYQRWEKNHFSFFSHTCFHISPSHKATQLWCYDKGSKKHLKWENTCLWSEKPLWSVVYVRNHHYFIFSHCLTLCLKDEPSHVKLCGGTRAKILKEIIFPSRKAGGWGPWVLETVGKIRRVR